MKGQAGVYSERKVRLLAHAQLRLLIQVTRGCRCNLAPADSGYRGGFNVDVMVDRFCSVTKEMRIEKQQLKCSSRGRAHLERCGHTNLSVIEFQFI